MRTYKVTINKNGKNYSVVFSTITQATICSDCLEKLSPMLSYGDSEEKAITHKEYFDLSLKKFNF